jgi:heme oxygenase
MSSTDPNASVSACPFMRGAANVPAVDTRPITQRLKEDNWDLHEQAEHDKVPQAMVKGEMSREGYVELLKQMWVVNRALDAALVEARATTPIINDLVSDRQLQEQYLRADLEHFGVDVDAIEATDAAQRMIEHVETLARTDPHALFGLHYVREGANNGNRFVAMKLKKAWGVEGEDGFRYLDPYGKEQRPLWDAWKVRLADYPLTEPEKDSVFAGARSMFERIIALHKDLESLALA